MRISDWRSDVCSSDLHAHQRRPDAGAQDVERLRLEHHPVQRRVAAGDVYRPLLRIRVDGDRSAGGKLNVGIDGVRIGGDGRGLAPEAAHDHASPRMAAVDDRQAALADMFEGRSEEHTSELQSLMRISYAVFCLKKKKTTTSFPPMNDKTLIST